MDERARRIASNEIQFRDINERLVVDLEQVPHKPDLLDFVCECGDQSCDALIQLDLHEYAAVREDSRRFAVVPHHVIPEVERVVDRVGDRFWTIEKLGTGAEMADRAARNGSGAEGPRPSDD
jgi:hypothetical protein